MNITLDTLLVLDYIFLMTNESLDRINNISQKEGSLSKVGISREKYLKVIARALTATKTVKDSKPDESGRYPMIEVPDDDLQKWGAEKAMLLFGDMIEHKEIKHDLGDSTLAELRKMSVAELKEKARMILEGKVVSAHSDATTISRMPPQSEDNEEY